MQEERDYQQKTLRHLGNVGFYVVKINKEYYFTTYEVRVQVFNDECREPECEGPISGPVVIYSAEDLPQVAPTQVGARPFNSTALNISWNEIPEQREKIRGELIGYRIKYWRQDLDEITESQYLLSRHVQPRYELFEVKSNELCVMKFRFK